MLFPSVYAQQQSFSTTVKPNVNILYVNPQDTNSTYAVVYDVKVSSIGDFEGKVDLDVWFPTSDGGNGLNWFLVQPHLSIPRNGSVVTALVITVPYDTSLKRAVGVVSASSSDGKYKTDSSFGLTINQVSASGQVDGAGLNVGGKLVIDFGDGSKMVCTSGTGCVTYDDKGNLLRFVTTTSTSSVTTLLTSSTSITITFTTVSSTTSTFLTTLTSRMMATTTQTATVTSTSTERSTSITTLTRETTTPHTTSTNQETVMVLEPQSNITIIAIVGGITVIGIAVVIALTRRNKHNVT